MTRRLIASGQRPVTVGMFFSLGHSTIVIITSLVVAGTAAAVSDKLGNFERVGGIIGTSVSAAFLLLFGLMNIYILYKLVIQMKKMIASDPGSEHEQFKIQGGGCLFPILQKLFKLVDRPWKMYPLGVLFGLGFDTSSEIAILGISSIQATKGTSDMADSDLSTAVHSWHVLVGYNRWRVDDELVYEYRASPRTDRNLLLQHRSYSHHGHCRDNHWNRTVPQSDLERRRTAWQILGRRRKIG
jgi:hypothetical protein